MRDSGCSRECGEAIPSGEFVQVCGWMTHRGTLFWHAFDQDLRVAVPGLGRVGRQIYCAFRIRQDFLVTSSSGRSNSPTKNVRGKPHGKCDAIHIFFSRARESQVYRMAYGQLLLFAEKEVTKKSGPKSNRAGRAAAAQTGISPEGRWYVHRRNKRTVTRPIHNAR